MNRFFTNLFGTTSNQAARKTRHQPRQNTIGSQIEALEGRMLLAARLTATAVVAPVVQVQPATVLRSTLPGTIGPRLVGPVGGLILKIEASSGIDAKGSPHDQACQKFGQTANDLQQRSLELADAGDWESSFNLAQMRDKVIDAAVDYDCVVIS
jgi:hypothetical protein